MKEFLSTHFLYLKVAHLVSVVAWFAGLFYIFRLFVYHAREKHEAHTSRTLALMESKLLKIIMYPATFFVLVTGLSLSIAASATWSQPWFHAKLTGVVFLLAYQELARRTHHRFARGDFFLTERQCRFINEVPTLLLIAIVALVVLKPF